MQFTTAFLSFKRSDGHAGTTYGSLFTPISISRRCFPLRSLEKELVSYLRIAPRNSLQSSKRNSRLSQSKQLPPKVYSSYPNPYQKKFWNSERFKDRTPLKIGSSMTIVILWWILFVPVPWFLSRPIRISRRSCADDRRWSRRRYRMLHFLESRSDIGRVSCSRKVDNRDANPRGVFLGSLGYTRGWVHTAMGGQQKWDGGGKGGEGFTV